jgi:hypothetical protein
MPDTGVLNLAEGQKMPGDILLEGYQQEEVLGNQVR